MRCAAPILAKGSTRHNPVWVPCSRCGYCISTRQKAWSFRLTEEMQQSGYPTLFCTLTYRNESLPYTLDDHPLIRKHFGDLPDEVTLLTRDVQLFNKLVRQNNSFHCDLQYRYYAAGEYGTKFGRPHYHLIMFNVHPKTMLKLQKFWKHGNIDLQECRSTEKVSNYVAGYIIGAQAHSHRINKRPFSIMSKRPYLGYTYVQRMYAWHKKNQLTYIERGDYKQALPRIFKNKIFEQYELNAFKQPALVQNDLAIENELHRLVLKNGADYDAFNALEKARIYHEQRIRENAKHNDNYEYQLGTRFSKKSIASLFN